MPRSRGRVLSRKSALTSRSGSTKTTKVGSKPNGASWVGALDLSGNVWQWMSSSYRSYPYDAKDGRESNEFTNNDDLRVLRGGSFNYGEDLLRSAARYYDAPGYND